MSDGESFSKLIVFDLNSWHYKLILYVWSEKFFLDTSQIDTKKLMDMDSTKFEELSWRDYPRLEKPKTINFCPYCRAIVGSAISAPFVFLWRLFPHPPKPQRTHAEIIRASEIRSKLVRTCVAAGMVGFGIWKIIDGDWAWSIFYFLIAAFNYKSPEVLKWVGTKMMKIKWPKWNRKKRKQITVSPEFFKKLQEKLAKKHEVICPPVYFIDKKPEELT